MFAIVAGTRHCHVIQPPADVDGGIYVDLRRKPCLLPEIFRSVIVMNLYLLNQSPTADYYRLVVKSPNMVQLARERP